jgi:hypothetical protein
MRFDPAQHKQDQPSQLLRVVLRQAVRRAAVGLRLWTAATLASPQGTLYVNCLPAGGADHCWGRKPLSLDLLAEAFCIPHSTLGCSQLQDGTH